MAREGSRIIVGTLLRPLNMAIVPTETHVQAQIYVRKILLDNFVIFMHTLGGVILDMGLYFYQLNTLWCQTNPRQVC